MVTVSLFCTVSDIARYWSKIAVSTYPPLFGAFVRISPRVLATEN